MTIKVFVGNLPEDCSQDSLRDVFGAYGSLDEVAVIKNYAFIHFLERRDATNAVKDLDGTKIGGKQISVEISKKQGDSRGRPENRDRDRGFNLRGRGGPDSSHHAGGILGAGPPLGGLGALGGAPLVVGPLGGGPLGGGPLGGGPLNSGPLNSGPLGALGAGPSAGAPMLGGLGILSAVNTLKAVAEKQQQLNSEKRQPSPERHFDQPDPGVRVRREVVHCRDVPKSASLGLTNGYVIYERYYVDPTHPSLKGLPLHELPRMSTNPAPQETRRNDSYKRKDDYDSYRERSPINGLRERNVGRSTAREYQNDYRY